MSESDSFEQEATDGISEQVDALKGFLDEKGLAGGSSPAADGGAGDDDHGTSSGQREDRAFDSAVSDVEDRWTSHGGEAPEHRPVAVAGADGSAGRSGDSGWEPVTAPDGEELDGSGGASDGSESGQDSGSMS